MELALRRPSEPASASNRLKVPTRNPHSNDPGILLQSEQFQWGTAGFVPSGLVALAGIPESGLTVWIVVSCSPPDAIARQVVAVISPDEARAVITVPYS